MKKLITIILLALMLVIIGMAAKGLPGIAEPVLVEAAEPTPEPASGPWTWAFLATIAGATAATLLIVQFAKVPLDRVWKIPTRLVVYVIALVILVVATAFTSGLDADNFLLCLLNAFIVALAAYGSYELTFARKDK